MSRLYKGMISEEVLDARVLKIEYIIHKTGEINPITNDPYIETTVAVKVTINDSSDDPIRYGDWMYVPDNINDELLSTYKNFLLTKVLHEISTSW